MLTEKQAQALDALSEVATARRVSRAAFRELHGKTVNSLIRAGYLVAVGDGLFELRDPREGGEESKPGRVTTRRMDRYRRRYLK